MKHPPRHRCCAHVKALRKTLAAAAFEARATRAALKKALMFTQRVDRRGRYAQDCHTSLAPDVIGEDLGHALFWLHQALERPA